MSRCIECYGTIKVNYSCYNGIYICNDCEQEYYNGNYELNSKIPKGYKLVKI